MTKELISYLQQEPILTKLMNGFREKYESYNAFAGKVVLRNLTIHEREVLEGFFGINIHGKKSITISAEHFKKALETGRYQSVEPEALLDEFFQEKIIGKKVQKAYFQEEKQKILHKWKEKYQSTEVSTCVEEFLEIIKLTGENLVEWEKNLYLGADIYNALPYRNKEQQYLAVFAAKITGDPHSFDGNTGNGNLLYQIVTLDLKQRGLYIEESLLFQAYKKQKSYVEAGILIDDISNYAMLYGVRAMKQNGEWHEGMEGFMREKQIVQIPLATISQWKSICCVNQCIYIVENPSIFAMLCAQYPENSYMCMNGQPRLSSLFIMELLEKTNTKVYYGGDLDPEGLLIAQKLKRFYKGTFEYWHMDGEDYKKALSQKEITPTRLKMLSHIEDAELQEIKKLILQEKKAAYQEKIFS